MFNSPTIEGNKGNFQQVLRAQKYLFNHDKQFSYKLLLTGKSFIKQADKNNYLGTNYL